MILYRAKRAQKGVSLIEVMIAVLIFTVGLIGVASLLVMATGANHGGFLRTQVTYLAQNMADRMSSNPIGVWQNSYNSEDYPLSSAAQDCLDSSCSPAQLAEYDQKMWSSQLKVFLPDAKATIACTAAGAGFLPQGDTLGNRPPFGGSCNMTITWTDRGSGAESSREAGLQTFAWEFQP